MIVGEGRAGLIEDGTGTEKRPVADTGSDAAFARLFLLAFMILGLITILNHEMWRDELQAWLIAKESTSLLDLFRNLRYMGHPGLWYTCLYVLAKFTHQPMAMQLFHLAVASAAAYVFLRHAPFPKVYRALFVFGYFPFYEYAVVSRNYVLGVFLVFLFCSLYRPPSRNPRYLVLSLVLFLLTQTSVYGVIIAISLAAALFLGHVPHTGSLRPTQGRYFVVAVVVVAGGILLAVLQLIKPADCTFASHWYFSIHVRRMLDTLMTVSWGFVPLPLGTAWNAFQAYRPLWGAAQLIAPLVLLLSAALLVRRTVPFLVWCSGTFGLLLFTYVKFIGSVRHHGHLFLLFIACLWLASHYHDTRYKMAWLNALGRFATAHRQRILLVILSVHLVAGASACIRDVLYPFSGSKDAAQFIRDRNMDNMLIVGDRDASAASVSAYLDRQIYYPSIGRLGSFVVWNRERREVADVFKEARELMVARKQDVLILLNYPGNPSSYAVEHLEEFPFSIARREKFYLYRMRYTDDQ